MLLSELECKTVINVVNGAKIGNISNLKLDPVTGQIYKIIVKEIKSIFNIFTKKEPVTIPWDQIIKIGEDVVIVNYPNSCKNEINITKNQK